jgi:hypothetical protein
MVDIIHRIGIKSSPAKVYEAVATLKGLAHWWTEEVRGRKNRQLELMRRKPALPASGS